MEGLEKSAFVLLPKSNSLEKKRDKLNFREKRHCRLDDSKVVVVVFFIILQRYGELNVMPLSQEIYRAAASQIAGI